jgi:hypothetical protein
MEYKIETASTSEKLVSAVTTAIAELWEPLGGVSIVYNDKDKSFIFAQAMTRSPLALPDAVVSPPK